MQEIAFTNQMHDHEIYGFHVQPETVKGIVVLVHGFGEHSGRYKEAVIPMLVKANFAVLCYDNIGHGASGGKRGHCSGYAVLQAVLEEHIQLAKSIYSNIPLYLYGHSMGGNLVLNYALRKTTQLSGIVATSPYLRLAFQPPKWKMVLGKMMMASSITLPSGLDPKGISRIAAEVEKYSKDPMVHDKVSPAYSFPIMEAGEWAIANAHKLICNTLLLHGTGDQIIDHKATQEFHQNSTQTSLKLYEGGYHELHYDRCKDEMLSDINSWLSQGI